MACNWCARAIAAGGYATTPRGYPRFTTVPER